MDSFSKWFRDVIHYLLPGFIYFLSIYIIIQKITNNSISLSDNFTNSNFIYIAILIIIISFTIGFCFHIALQGLIWFLCPKFRKEFGKLIRSNLEFKELYIIRKDQILVRHLIISILILGCIILFKYKFDKTGFCLFALCLFIVSCMIIGYFYLRKMLIDLKKMYFKLIDQTEFK
jgi:hypothetical protein